MGSVRANRSSAPENDAGVRDIGLDGSVLYPYPPPFWGRPIRVGSVAKKSRAAHGKVLFGLWSGVEDPKQVLSNVRPCACNASRAVGFCLSAVRPIVFTETGLEFAPCWCLCCGRPPRNRTCRGLVRRSSGFELAKKDASCRRGSWLGGCRCSTSSQLVRCLLRQIPLGRSCCLRYGHCAEARFSDFEGFHDIGNCSTRRTPHRAMGRRC